MKILLIVAFVFSSALAQSEECPAELVLKVPKLSQQEKRVSNEYARCMEIPYLPLANQKESKRIQCAPNRIGPERGRLSDALKWIDKMATNFAGCETNLRVERK